MIPILDEYKKPMGEYKKTLADEMLSPYNNDLAIYISIDGEVKKVPVWQFIECFLRVKDKEGNIVCFEINKAQCDLYIEICKQRRMKKPVRIDILKARQLGFSTFIAALLFVLTLLVPNQTACIIADISEHATNLFNKYKFFYESLPDYFKKHLPLKSSNAKEIKVDYGNGEYSCIRVLVQGENAGRSDTCQYLHLSEVAFWQDIKNTTASIQATVSDSNLNSMIFYETTANSVNYYKTIWDMDYSGKTDFTPLFYAWYLDKDYIAEYDGFDLFEWEVKMKDKYNLSMEQVAWYRRQYKKVRGDLQLLKQEYPSSPVEAFIVSGASVFNMEMVLERKSYIMEHEKELVKKRGSFEYVKKVSIDGSRTELENVRFVNNEYGEIKIFEEPIKGHYYIVSNDPAMGGEDYFATQVVDNYNMKQVAVYHKNKDDSDRCAYEMYCLGKYYNNAMITGETNTTSLILKRVYECGYDFIYQDHNQESLGIRFQDRLGFKTTISNRKPMIDMFVEHFRDNPNIINDYETICEMENFQYIYNENTQKSKAQAIGGAHDDLVMSYCGACYCRGDQKSVPSNTNEGLKMSNYDYYDPYEIYKRNKKKNNIRNVYQQWD